MHSREDVQNYLIRYAPANWYAQPGDGYGARVRGNSSVPTDINGENPVNHANSIGGRQLKTYLDKDVFFYLFH